jgi:hypothetical protein
MIYVSDQDIKKLMAKRKRELATVKRSFPKYKPGDTVGSYIAQYAVLNGPATWVLPFDVDKYAHPATVPSGPDVIEEPAE